MTISSEEARALLYDLHGGQDSPEYAAASSGLVVRPDLLISSLLHAARREHDPQSVAELYALLDYVRDQVDEAPRRIVGDVAYIALPWAQEYLK